MKVTFLYDDKEHATPILRAADVLARRNIVLESAKTESVESVARLVPSDIDVLMLHQTLMSDDAVDHNKPIVILERIDGAQLAASRRWLSVESVKAIAKGYCYTRPEINNTHRGRYHAHLLKDAGVTIAPGGQSNAVAGLPSPQLSSAELSKIVPVFGFGAYSKMDVPRHQMIDFASTRKYDLHCVGYVDYAGSEIERHRCMAMDISEQYGVTHPGKVIVGRGRVLRPNEYLESMFSSKAVVSPWGWGEACHRDYEAWLLGAVLIKPPMDHVRSWPEVYRPYETYIPCKMDFSDLPEIVDSLVDDWPKWEERRRSARDMAMEAGDSKRVGVRMAGILEQAI